MNSTDAYNVLGLFDGHSGGQIALEVAGIKVNRYYASEVDKYSKQLTYNIFPNTIQLGDVRKLRLYLLTSEKNLQSIENYYYTSTTTKGLIKYVREIKQNKIDLLIGGSPCTGFSFAGKQLNFNDPQSKLFFEYVKIKNYLVKLNPKLKFLLENVNMKKKYLGVISKYMGIFAVNINSNLVSGQNRNRWYWTNIKTTKQGLFGDLHSDIPQPKNKHIFLKDILQPENEVDVKYHLSTQMDAYIKSNWRLKKKEINNKANCISTNEGQRASVNFLKLDIKGNKKTSQNKASCLTGGGHSGGNHSDMDIICVSMVGRKLNENGVRKDNDKNIKAVQQLESNGSNKTNCLTTVQKDNLLLIQKGHGYNNHIDNKKTLRRLTPRECGRLQTIPDHILDIMLNCGVSDTQLYRNFGNGWTIDVIAHQFSFLKTNN